MQITTPLVAAVFGVGAILSSCAAETATDSDQAVSNSDAPVGAVIAAVGSDPNATGECLIDQQGADDEPGQKDLNEFCEEAGNNTPFDLHVSWNFDDTMWSGANTGDACSLFDTDGDTFANFALCVTLDMGPPAVQTSESPRLYECGDDRVDRCTNSRQFGVCENDGFCGVTGEACNADSECPQSFGSQCVANPGTCSNDSTIFCDDDADCGTGNTCLGTGTQDNDPFNPNVCNTDLGRCIADGVTCTTDADCSDVHTGNNACSDFDGTPESCDKEDSHVVCWLEADDLPGNETCDLNSFSCTNIPNRLCQSDGDCIPITDVCSYPSQQPNSDPSDCIVTPTGQSPCTDNQGQVYDCSPNDTDCATTSCDPFGEEANCDILTPKPAGTLCRAGSGDDCDPDEFCNDDGVCPDDIFDDGTTVCNAGSDDVCDPDELCPGVAGEACPEDTVSSEGTLCREGSGDVCDPDEFCTGVADEACPDDGFEPPDTKVCRQGSGDLCDPDELCTGVAGEACPADVVATNTTVCNPGSGDICDPDELCTGNPGEACPDDSFAPMTTVCRFAAGVCDVAESCTGVADEACPDNSFQLPIFECASSTGECDLAEFCTGLSAVCPADGPNLTTECRRPAGVCDVAEFCSDASDACPADLKDSTTVCGPSQGVCDPEEVCDGTNNACPVDLKDSTTVCGPSQGVCDPEEVCDGTNNACPADLKDSTTVCGPSQGVCDPEEVCDGTNNACPADLKDSTTVCGPSQGVCDPEEVCDGTNNACPADLKDSTTVCGPSQGVCDPEEVCDGTNNACPADLKDSTTVCGPSQGVCDPEEVCDGTNNACPADLKDSTTVCGPSQGECDPEEVCDGTNNACPADLKDSTTVCGPSQGECDPEEVCDGTNNACPADLKDSTTVCGPSQGECDPEEVCDGTNNACPADLKDSTTVCGPSQGECDPEEVCDGTNNACPADLKDSTTVCGPSQGECDPEEVCDGTNNACPADAKSTASCRDPAGICDVEEFCDGINDDCPADGFQDDDYSCRPDAGVCDAEDFCPGDGPDCPDVKDVCAFVTDSSLCPFDVDPDKGICNGGDNDGKACSLSNGDGDCTPGTCEQSSQFRLLFSPDVKNWEAYKQNATNPGQYYYNLVSEYLDDVINITIPYPFVTQGARPVHVYCGEDAPQDDYGCFMPVDAKASFAFEISLQDYIEGTNMDPNRLMLDCAGGICGPDGVGSCTFQVNLADIDLTACSTDQAYVNVHLDWGLKGPMVDANPCGGFCDDGYICDTDADCSSGTCNDIVDRYDRGGADGAYFDALVDTADEDGPEAISNCRSFQFQHSNNGTFLADAVQNVNVFKRIAGAFGQCRNPNNGEPCNEDLVVELIRNSTGELVQAGLTDDDGFYALPYKHRGKPSIYTVRVDVPGCSLVSQEIELQGNGWSNVTFDADTCTSTAEYGSGRNQKK